MGIISIKRINRILLCQCCHGPPAVLVPLFSILPVVEINGYRIDLHRDGKPVCPAYDSQNLIQRICPGNGLIKPRIQSIQTDIDRIQPAFKSSPRYCSRRTPLVVRVTFSIPGTFLSIRTNWGQSLRTSGSPPVTLIFLIPRSAAQTAIASSSSRERISPPGHTLDPVRHTVFTSQITAVCNGDPHIIDFSSRLIPHFLPPAFLPHYKIPRSFRRTYALNRYGSFP